MRLAGRRQHTVRKQQAAAEGGRENCSDGSCRSAALSRSRFQQSMYLRRRRERVKITGLLL
jgi:hypothetical protein